MQITSNQKAPGWSADDVSKSIFCLVIAIKAGQVMSQVASLETPRTLNNKHEVPVEVQFCQGEKS